jgi:hypothetical protein
VGLVQGAGHSRRNGSVVRVTARTLQLDISGLMLDTGLLIDTVRLTGGGMTYDAETTRLSLPVAASLTAQISSASVAKFVAANPQDEIKDLDVLLGEGRVIVRCKIQRVVSVNVQATGELVAVDGTKVEFRPTEVRAAGFGLPGGLVEGVLEQINPLVDLSDLPFPVNITGIRIDPAGITIEASAGPI